MPPRLLRLKNKKSGLRLLENLFFDGTYFHFSYKNLQFKPLYLFTPENNDVPYSTDFFEKVIFVSTKAT